MSPMVIVHVAAGTLAVLAGAAAFLLPKGRAPHALAGRVFVVSLLVTALGGSVYAAELGDPLSALIGLLCSYLVTTSWLTVRRGPRPGRAVEGALAIVAAAIASGFALCAVLAARSSGGMFAGFPMAPYAIFSLVAGLCVVADLAVTARRSLARRHRLARHLWRMGFALWIAAGSLLDGPGTKIFPEGLHGTPILTAPLHLTAAGTLAWLVAVLLDPRRDRRNMGAGRPSLPGAAQPTKGSASTAAVAARPISRPSADRAPSSSGCSASRSARRRSSGHLGPCGG